MAAADSSQEFLTQYVTELRDLTFNSKAIINTLTMLASENKQAAASIADAIENHILMCPAPHKLPALYLLDSIVKNVGLPYTALFARNLPQVYLRTWQNAPESRPSLQKLYNTWHRYFVPDVLSSISQQTADQGVQPVSQTSTSYQYPQQASSAQPSTYFPGQQGQSPNRVNQGAWAQQYVQPHAYANGNPVYQLPTYQQQPQYAQPAPYYQQPQQDFGQPVNAQYAAAYTPTYPQPQYQGSQPSSANPSPSYPATAHISPGYAAANLQQPGPSDSRAALPDFLSQLIGAGVIPAGKVPPSSQAVLKPVAPPSTFDPSTMKVLNDAAVQQLRAGTDASRAKFLDQRLAKQRRMAAGGKHSRQWFVNERDWLAGTTADAQAAPAFFDDLEQAEQIAAKEEDTSVPADASQPCCALSGERFDSFWDDTTNAWRYKAAVVLDAEQATRYGLPEGALVKVSCLGPPGDLEIGGAAETVQAAEGQEAAEEVAAAAAAEVGTDEQADQKDNMNIGEKRIADADEKNSPKRQRLG